MLVAEMNNFTYCYREVLLASSAQLRIPEGTKILNPLTLLAGRYAREEMINYNTYVRELDKQ